jgi:hypothetical protein
MCEAHFPPQPAERLGEHGMGSDVTGSCVPLTPHVRLGSSVWGVWFVV